MEELVDFVSILSIALAGWFVVLVIALAMCRAASRADAAVDTYDEPASPRLSDLILTS